MSANHCSFKHAFIFILVGLPVLVAQSSAVAGIAEFNAAVAKRDFKTAAAEAVVVWDSYDKSNPAAPIVAREFAFVNYLAEDFSAAKTFIDDLVDPNNELSTRDEQASLSRVLADLIALRLDNGMQRRNQLMDSLKKRIAAPDLDNITLVAAEFLYNEDWKHSRWSEASASAALAAELYGRQGKSLIVHKRRAELIGVVSGFLIKRDGRIYDRLVDLHDNIVIDVDAAQDSLQREKLIELKWVAQAWVGSIEALDQSYYSQTGSQINTEIKPRDLRRSEHGYFYEFTNATDFRPPCEVTLDNGKLRYPHSAEFWGTVGSVIVKMDFDERGKGSEATLLASVPSKSFAKNVLKAAPTFRLKPKRGQDMDKCSLSRKDVVVPVMFIIQ
jgi:TonB family protein